MIKGKKLYITLDNCLKNSSKHNVRNTTRQNKTQKKITISIGVELKNYNFIIFFVFFLFLKEQRCKHDSFRVYGRER